MSQSQFSNFIDRPLVDDLLTTANTYTNVPIHWPNDDSAVRNDWPCSILTSKTLTFHAATNDLLVRVVGSRDSGATFPHTAVTEFTVAAGSYVTKNVGNQFDNLKIQVKPAADNVHGSLGVHIHGSTQADMTDVEVSVEPPMTGAVGITGVLPDTSFGDIRSSSVSLAAIAKRYSQNINLKIDFASSAEQTIVVAPAPGYRVVIQSIYLTCQVNNVVVMKSGATEIGKAYVYGFSKDYISGLVLGIAEAFKLMAATADPIYGQVCYYIEAV